MLKVKGIKLYSLAFFLLVEQTRIRKFDIPIWNIKLGRNTNFAFCYYRIYTICK
jgi:hypothetical protein